MNKSVHEPEAKMMSVEDVRTDAQRIADVIRRNMLKAEPMVGLKIPLSVLLSSLASLKQDELVMLRKRVEELLTV
jgi:hypothetical protein